MLLTVDREGGVLREKTFSRLNDNQHEVYGSRGEQTKQENTLLNGDDETSAASTAAGTPSARMHVWRIA